MDRGVIPPGSENCLAVGTRLAEFEITGVIGEGGFGIVYLAFDHSLQRTVALKEYMPSTLAARSADGFIAVRAQRHEDAFKAGLRSFINEARLLARFDHPALVKVYRFWEDQGTAYMAMRYYEGRTFKSVVLEAREAGEPLDEAALRSILRPMLGALEALYASNILHRDISPENIVILPNGAAVLLDFGAARQIVSGMNSALTVILKPGYAPVEQYANDDAMPQGPWTDIYSLAAVMYFAVTGSAPAAAVGRMLKDPLVPLAGSGVEGFSQAFLAAIDKGLAVKPDDRPRSIAEFARLMGLDLASASGAPTASTTLAPAHGPASVGGVDAGSGSAGAIVRALAASVAHAIGRARAAAGNVKASLGSAAALREGGAVAARDGAADHAQAQDAHQAAAFGPPRRWIAAAGGVLLLGVGAWWLASRTAAPLPAPAHAARAAVAPAPATLDAARGVSAAASVSGKEEIVSWDTARKELAAAEHTASARTTGHPGAAHAPSAPQGLVPAHQALAAGGASATDALAAPQGQRDGTAPGAVSAKGDDGASKGSGNAVAKSASKPVAKTGRVSLAVLPWGSVTVDGASKGVTPPLKTLNLAPGRHEIKITNPAYAPYTATVTVDEGKTVTVARNFAAPN